MSERKTKSEFASFAFGAVQIKVVRHFSGYAIKVKVGRTWAVDSVYRSPKQALPEFHVMCNRALLGLKVFGK